MTGIIEYVVVSGILLAIGIYGLVVKRNFIRLLFSIEIIANAANLNLVAFSRHLPTPDPAGQITALFSIAIAAAEVAVGLALMILAYRLYNEIDVKEFRGLRG
ncbi:MAG: NADH-quinone oxidoreductase subunit NuoK [Candidatus Nitrosothermus koennekii]|nr:MAG: NADH-quinone oxidoreductase subunit NuoK [Candidatus Nitrosothermus koennekii]